MALMSEERRKEMEEEMNRFELEIAAPGGNKPSPSDLLIGSKPLSPPPAPPAVPVLIPEVLTKAPPPPPPPSSPPLHAVLRAPPPPPPPPVVQARPQTGPIRFIPHQLQRQPSRPPMRPNFVPMRSMHIEGPPGPFPTPGMMGHFIPPMGQNPHIVGPQITGPPMHSMGPGHMHMMPGPMPMPPQMENMNMNLMPPGFYPPPGPAPTMMPGRIPCDSMSQTFIPNEGAQDFVAVSTSASTSEPVLVAAPAIYASPFVKSHAENSSDTPASANGQDNFNISTGIINITKSEKHSTKSEDHVVGPAVPSVTNNEEIVVSSKKKEKKKKSVRMAGGQAWEDNSLMDWETDDFRIFCGDLGNDVTDEVLIRAFSKYASFVKAKVIRDKRTNKTKGYGFVSFKDPQDFIKAMREMNGKYVGSRPIKLRKSTWKDRNIDIVKKKQREKEKLGLL